MRMAVILTETMNTKAILHNDELLQATDPIDMKLVLLWLADELRKRAPEGSLRPPSELTGANVLAFPVRRRLRTHGRS